VSNLIMRAQALAAHLGTNPLALIIFGAFLLAEYGNWQHEVQIDRLCAVIEPADFIYKHPTTRLQEAQRICATGGSALPDWWPSDNQ
jgi:hypothetical protein